jgi:hypothetical protein
MAPDGQASMGMGTGGAEQSRTFRERARRARTIAARYRGEAARVLIEIAEDFDARAARLETQAG